MSYRIYFVGVLNIGEKLNKSPIAKIKSSPINLPVRYMQHFNLIAPRVCTLVLFIRNANIHYIYYGFSSRVPNGFIIDATLACK